MTYSTVEDARTAFMLERLDFKTGDRPYVILVGHGKTPVGHERVTVMDLVGISGPGDPIFRCRRPSGEMAEFDMSQLHTETELLYTNERMDELSIYGTWFFREQQKARERSMRPPGPPLPVTFSLRF